MKYKKQSDGRYFASVWDGTYTSSGKKHYKRIVSSKSAKDLEKKVDEFKFAVNKGLNVISSDVTFGEYANLWLDTAKAVRSGNTKAMYKNVIDKHLCDISMFKLEQIKHSTIQLLINERVDRPRTCQQILLTMKQIIRMAEKDHLLPRGASDELFADISLPKYKSKEKRPLTDAEKASLKTADFTDRERAFVTLLYATGLRREEACALTVFDINFKEKYINVGKALAFVNTTEELKEPKSENGYRKVPMPDYLCTLLKHYLCTINGTQLFVMNNGQRMTLSGYKNMWCQIRKKMKQAYINAKLKEDGNYNPMFENWAETGFDDLTAHIFRHNYCTMLCYEMMAGNISAKRIASLMGDTEAVVMKIYSHVVEERENVVEAVETALAL